MTKIIIHIGTKKTGSTAIQSFFALNREQLIENGVYYYQTLQRYRPYLGNTNGDFFELLFKPQVLIMAQETIEKSKQLEIAHFKESVKKYPVIVFSDELLWVRSKDYWGKVLTFLKDICGEDVEIEIIVYLRRQDEYFIADWKEMEKSFLPKRINSFPKTYLNILRQNYDFQYNSVLKNLENVFGIEHIKLRIYDRERLLSQGRAAIIKDFFETCDIPFKESYVIPDKDRSNESLPLEVCYALVIVNALLVWFKRNQNRPLKQRIRTKAIEYANKHPKKDNQSLLSVEERKQILASCEKDNAEIAQRYFHRDWLFDSHIKENKKYKPSCLKSISIALSILWMTKFDK